MDMSEFKYITYSNVVPLDTLCIRVGAEKIEDNVMRKVDGSRLWNYPTFSWLHPEEHEPSPYGNIYWMYDAVWVTAPIEVEVWVYGGGKRVSEFETATIEVKEGDDIYSIARKITARWK